ncbi:MAG TPA: glycosyltransferase family 2 protein [Gaiellaceae bacterium]|jgi:GT2 family glycosyltransferase
MTIGIVTPTLNHGRFLDETIRSVLDAATAPAEYVVVDGGSTDDSVAVLERYDGRLTAWSSEPDDGMYDAIQKGFTRTSSDVMAWLNAGDTYQPWTLSVVQELFATFPELEWLTTQRPLTLDEAGRVVACEFVGGYAADSFRAGVNLPGGNWFARAGIQQESTFWRRSLWERAGGRLSASLQYAGDFELWLRFFDAGATLVSLDAPLAAHRVHAGQKTTTLDAYVAEATAALEAAGHGGPSGSALRRLAYVTLGRRPLRRLPRSLARGLVAAGALSEVETIVWRDGGWQLARDYAA